jgi:lipopolysaccharide transport system permease protein
VLGAYFNALGSLIILLIAVLILRGGVPLSVLALPFIFIAFLPFLLGLSYLLSAMGPYIRDISQGMGMLVSFTMFLSPVFYPISGVSKDLQPFLLLNPLTLIIENLRHSTLSGQWPDWSGLMFYFVLSTALLVFGAYCFNYLRKGFADVV